MEDIIRSGILEPYCGFLVAHSSLLANAPSIGLGEVKQALTELPRFIIFAQESDLSYQPTTLKELVPGLKIGHLRILRKLRDSSRCSQMTKKRWKCKCEAPNCGEEIVVPGNYLIRRPNPKTHCGCLFATIKSTHKQEYGIWTMMKVRCYDENHVAYRHYGGRGIRVCDAWLCKETGFEAFLKEVGPRPSATHSIDRKDVNGNYEPGNVRWATAKEQAANKRS